MAGNPAIRQLNKKVSDNDGNIDVDKKLERVNRGEEVAAIGSQSTTAQLRTAARSQALIGEPGRNAKKSLGIQRVRGKPSKTNLAEPEQAETRVANSAITVRAKDTDKLSIPDNVLLPYVNLQYHMVWSMVPTDNLPKIQQNIPRGASPGNAGTFDELTRAILAEGSVPFASTGDVFRFERAPEEPAATTGRVNRAEQVAPPVPWTPKKGRHYYNIESVTLDNVMAPTAANPYINSMVTGKMNIVEPHGFKWNEDARRVANDNGYNGISLGRVVWRLDIFFSGYNQDTGEWSPFIELDTRAKKTKLLTYYMNITTVDAKVTHTGTTYDMSIVPSGHSAYRPEEVVVAVGAIFTGSQSNAQTFGGFLERVSQVMNKAVSDRTNEQVVRNYEFKAPPELLAAEFFSGEFERKHGFLKNDPKGGSTVSTSRDANVISLLEDALKDLELTWNQILKKDDPKHLKPRIHWGIRFNVVYGSGVNPGTNDFDGITNQYIIEPFVTYKHATINNRDEMAKVVEVNAQADRVEEMLRLGMINRIYNYINTSENNEVIEVDIALKNFYYHTMFTGAAGKAGANEVTSSSSNAKKVSDDSLRIDKEGANSTDQGEAAVPSNLENSVQSSLRRLFGSSIDNPSATCDARTFKTAYDTYGGGFGEMPKTDARGSVGSEDILTRNEYQANINDHIKNDMIRIDIEVRGDPLWLLSPYGKDSGNLLTIGNETTDTTSTSALVQTQSARCFFLRMFAPHQDDYMNPDRNESSTACSILGGFYETIKVNSVFKGGKFTQTITAAKMNHLNYVENNISLATNSQVVGEGVTTDTDASLTNSTPIVYETPAIDVTGEVFGNVAA
jgi:hypothetical protein